MLTALDPKKVHKFNLEAESKLPENERTYFLLRPLNSRQWREVKNLLMDKNRRGDQVDLTIRLSLIGWKNLADSNGLPTDFTLNPADAQFPEEQMDRLLEPWKDEIAAFITRISYLGEADAIKSDAPSGSR